MEVLASIHHHNITSKSSLSLSYHYNQIQVILIKKTFCIMVLNLASFLFFKDNKRFIQINTTSFVIGI